MQSAAFEPAGPFPVYVPWEDSPTLAQVALGSAVVGFPTEAEPAVVHVFYEGNVHHSAALRRFADRVHYAAGRCRWFRFDPDAWRAEHPDRPAPQVEHGYATYPTRAQALVPAANLAHVANYDDHLGIVAPLGADQATLLFGWIGADDERELRASGALFEARRRAGQA